MACVPDNCIGTGKTGWSGVPAPRNRQRATRPEPYFLGAAPIAPRNCRQWTLFGSGIGFRPAFQTMQNLPLSIRRLDRRGEASMRIGDLFQWERFVTPTIIKFFYWLAVVVSVLIRLARAVSALATMALNPFVGMIFLISSLLGACMG